MLIPGGQPRGGGWAQVELTDALLLGFEAASGMKVEFLLISPLRLSIFSSKDFTPSLMLDVSLFSPLILSTFAAKNFTASLMPEVLFFSPIRLSIFVSKDSTATLLP